VDVGGYELGVRLTSAATARQVSAIADRLEEQFARSYPGADLAVTSYDPEDGKPAELTVASPHLMSINPHEVRQIANGVADATANDVVVAETRDVAVLDTWLRALRES
jgi:hypothetical protein